MEIEKQNSEHSTEKNKFGGVISPDFKISFEAIIFERMQYCQRN